MAGVVIRVIPTTALITLATVPLSYLVYVQIRAFRGEVSTLVPALGKNVVVTLATPLLLFVGILIGIAL